MPVPTLLKRLSILPDPVAQSNQFLLWKSEWDNKRQRLVRTPFYADGFRRKGVLGGPRDLRRLVSLAQAAKAYEAAPDVYDGVGLALLGNGIAAFDLDKCFDEDGAFVPDHPGAHLASQAERAGAYMEVSPSGRGLRILGSSDVLEAYSRGGVEYWGQKRYVTLTGDLWANPRGWKDLSHFRRSLATRKTSEGPTDHEEVLITSRVIRELEDALSAIPSDERDVWIRMGHALKTVGEKGKALWLEWSAKSDKFDPEDAEATWESLRPERTSHRAVFTEAQNEWGWENPRSRKKRTRGSDDEDDEEEQAEDSALNPDNLLDYAIDLGEQKLVATEFVLDGFLTVGVSLIAGSWGSGKSTNLIPVFASVAHLAPVEWEFNPVLRRPVLWVTEAPGQARDVLYSLAKAEGSASWEDFKKWFYVVPAHRTEPRRLAKRVAKAVEELTYTLPNGFAVRPVVVLDTTSANLDLLNESDNSEVGEAMARLKERLVGVPLVLIGHTPKASRDTVDTSFRGAGAWEADASATYFLVHHKDSDLRILTIGKIRFSPDYTAISFGQAGGRELVKTEWGDVQSKPYLHGVPCKSTSSNFPRTEKPDEGEEAPLPAKPKPDRKGALRKQTSEDREARELTKRQEWITNTLEDQSPLPEKDLVDRVAQKLSSDRRLVQAALERLVEGGLVARDKSEVYLPR